ncbi:hypothetical protein I4I84_14705, partial [Pseudonocardia sp. KRD-182]
MTEAEIEELLDGYGATAAVVARSRVDGVEVHSAASAAGSPSSSRAAGCRSSPRGTAWRRRTITEAVREG